MHVLSSYVCGEFLEGDGEGSPLVNPATEEVIARTSTVGLDLGAAVRYGRERGGPALRGMNFAERGALLEAMSKALHDQREDLLRIAAENGGNTRSDAKFDVDGATGTLAAYASLAKGLGEGRLLADDEGHQIGRTARYWGRHVLVPREGVAVLVNAFNFPAWGFAEKAACALLAGVPVIVKPGTSTSILAWRMMEILAAGGFLPEGAIQLVCGSAGDLLSHLTEQDVVAFTGSAATGARIRSMPELVSRSVTVNIEADSLNAAVLAPGLDPEGDIRRLFVKDVVREMTQKAGQKCTAVRRILVPVDDVDRVADEIAAALSAVKVGNPADPEVRMGPLTTAGQLRDGRAGLGRLAEEGRIVVGGPDPVAAEGVPAGKGYFLAPTLLVSNDPERAEAVHDVEVFGPVATILPYDGSAESAAFLVRRGKGCLVSSAYGEDTAWIEAVVAGLAAWNGRIYLGTPKVADMAIGSGMALPSLKHGGPGRAGGGEELGGLSGLRLYQQRCALQGDQSILKRLV